MKRLTGFMGLVLLATTIVGTLTYSQSIYTKAENQMIEFANNKMEQIYSVKIDKNNLRYSIGEQVQKNKFKKIQEKSNSEVVAITATNLEKLKKGNVLSYSFKYDFKDKKVISHDLKFLK
ncbi:hypothetical protein [Paraclostridium sordellii]|uniref:hypothetical protein n=1 Tax=Paraclostridium sordellii TaxID=1505 RepID=UPI0005DD1F04|nr:hypothetical protein [Paeniclostridium sordellii]QYE98935.1 hypothetical protein KZ987_05300 [Paeniclostridium sordellii]CEO06402.1 Uncharacterised protein [[Clostridium] sordellii] [Paeniclostridium sordellii]CEP86519.1 Uncharacterised protein [[Clostridium] sordellii] [Paeniclostridium sordellii]CEP96770.1 Uncharacterised protein [[Clostridium] sordellii] [Paeniclostridium sordellii]CEP99764.1 Uncharacterised protein [[Clostridium] sordellii] [Paeniclostridium sordellii]